jgi:hypothetical protein
MVRWGLANKQYISVEIAVEVSDHNLPTALLHQREAALLVKDRLPRAVAIVIQQLARRPLIVHHKYIKVTVMISIKDGTITTIAG